MSFHGLLTDAMTLVIQLFIFFGDGCDTVAVYVRWDGLVSLLNHNQSVTLESQGRATGNWISFIQISELNSLFHTVTDPEKDSEYHWRTYNNNFNNSRPPTQPDWLLLNHKLTEYYPIRPRREVRRRKIGNQLITAFGQVFLTTSSTAVQPLSPRTAARHSVTGSHEKSLGGSRWLNTD